MQFITEENMERRRQTMTEALKLAEEALDQHKQLGMNQTIDADQLSPIVLAFVRKSQSKLSAEFKRKISLVQWDTNDVQLVQAFYELKPTEDQVLDSEREIRTDPSISMFRSPRPRSFDKPPWTSSKWKNMSPY